MQGRVGRAQDDDEVRDITQDVKQGRLTCFPANVNAVYWTALRVDRTLDPVDISVLVVGSLKSEATAPATKSAPRVAWFDWDPAAADPSEPGGQRSACRLLGDHILAELGVKVESDIVSAVLEPTPSATRSHTKATLGRDLFLFEWARDAQQGQQAWRAVYVLHGEPELGLRPTPPDTQWLSATTFLAENDGNNNNNRNASTTTTSDVVVRAALARVLHLDASPRAAEAPRLRRALRRVTTTRNAQALATTAAVLALARVVYQKRKRRGGSRGPSEVTERPDDENEEKFPVVAGGGGGVFTVWGLARNSRLVRLQYLPGCPRAYQLPWSSLQPWRAQTPPPGEQLEPFVPSTENPRLLRTAQSLLAATPSLGSLLVVHALPWLQQFSDPRLHRGVVSLLTFLANDKTAVRVTTQAWREGTLGLVMPFGLALDALLGSWLTYKRTRPCSDPNLAQPALDGIRATLAALAGNLEQKAWVQLGARLLRTFEYARNGETNGCFDYIEIVLRLGAQVVVACALAHDAETRPLAALVGVQGTRLVVPAEVVLAVRGALAVVADLIEHTLLRPDQWRNFFDRVIKPWMQLVHDFKNRAPPNLSGRGGDERAAAKAGAAPTPSALVVLKHLLGEPRVTVARLESAPEPWALFHLAAWWTTSSQVTWPKLLSALQTFLFPSPSPPPPQAEEAPDNTSSSVQVVLFALVGHLAPALLEKRGGVGGAFGGFFGGGGLQRVLLGQATSKTIQARVERLQATFGAVQRAWRKAKSELGMTREAFWSAIHTDANQKFLVTNVVAAAHREPGLLMAGAAAEESSKSKEEESGGEEAAEQKFVSPHPAPAPEEEEFKHEVTGGKVNVAAAQQQQQQPAEEVKGVGGGHVEPAASAKGAVRNYFRLVFDYGAEKERCVLAADTSDAAKRDEAIKVVVLPPPSSARNKDRNVDWWLDDEACLRSRVGRRYVVREDNAEPDSVVTLVDELVDGQKPLTFDNTLTGGKWQIHDLVPGLDGIRSRCGVYRDTNSWSNWYGPPAVCEVPIGQHDWPVKSRFLLANVQGLRHSAKLFDVFEPPTGTSA